MNINRYIISLVLCAVCANASAWQAKVTSILQHGDWVAVTLDPDPGPQGCQKGSPYLIKVDESAESQQLFSIVLTALSTGNTIGGYEDPCIAAIWADTRPSIRRLYINSN